MTLTDFADMTHYREKLARRMEAAIIALLRSRAGTGHETAEGRRCPSDSLYQPRLNAARALKYSRNGAAMPRHSPDATEPDIQTWCAAYLRKALKLPDAPIDVHAEFASLGLDSAESVFFVAAIEDWLGLELASDTAMEHPTHRAIDTLRRRPAQTKSRAAPTRR